MLWAAEGSASLRRSSSIVWREGGFDARCLSVYYAKWNTSHIESHR